MITKNISKKTNKIKSKPSVKIGLKKNKKIESEKLKTIVSDNKHDKVSKQKKKSGKKSNANGADIMKNDRSCSDKIVQEDFNLSKDKKEKQANKHDLSNGELNSSVNEVSKGKKQKKKTGKTKPNSVGIENTKPVSNKPNFEKVDSFDSPVIAEEKIILEDTNGILKSIKGKKRKQACGQNNLLACESENLNELKTKKKRKDSKSLENVESLEPILTEVKKKFKKIKIDDPNEENNLLACEFETHANELKTKKKRKHSKSLDNVESLEPNPTEIKKKSKKIKKDDTEISSPNEENLENGKTKKKSNKNKGDDQNEDTEKTKMNSIESEDPTGVPESVNQEGVEKNPVDLLQLKENTIFVGNVPLNCTKKPLSVHFKKYGPISAIRFRCAPVADVRVSKKVAFIRKEFHPNRTSLNAYVRFVNKEDAEKAVAENGQLFKGHHLRVDLCTEKQKQDDKCALFIGNLDFSAEDEDLWNLFESCGEIDSVRICRDTNGVCLGTAYINFKRSDSVELALQMGDVVFKKRVLRVQASKGNYRRKDKKLKKTSSTPIANNKGPFKQNFKKPQGNNNFNPRKDNFQNGRNKGFNKSKGKMVKGKKGPFNKKGPQEKFKG